MMMMIKMLYVCIDLCLFPFVYVVMNSVLHDNCGCCPYFTWYLQNACCTDFLNPEVSK